MLRRQSKKRELLGKVDVVCEGDVTEGTYFEAIRTLRRIPKSRLSLHLATGTPLTVVKHAVGLKQANDRKNSLEKIKSSDPVWAVFDRDDHPAIPEAQRLAAKHSIKVAFSNPCFELFLLWHFQELRRQEHRRVVTRLLKEHIPKYDKSYDYSEWKLHTRYERARARALAANSRSELSDGIQSAPYSGLIPLVDYLRTY